MEFDLSIPKSDVSGAKGFAIYDQLAEARIQARQPTSIGASP